MYFGVGFVADVTFLVRRVLPVGGLRRHLRRVRGLSGRTTCRVGSVGV